VSSAPTHPQLPTPPPTLHPSSLKHGGLALSPLVTGDSRDEQKQCVFNMPFAQVIEVIVIIVAVMFPFLGFLDVQKKKKNTPPFFSKLEQIEVLLQRNDFCLGRVQQKYFAGKTYRQ
jgi:hypothetical protein